MWRDAEAIIPNALSENPLIGLQSLDFCARSGYTEHVPDKATLRD